MSDQRDVPILDGEGVSHALAAIPSGLFIVTCGAGDARDDGFLASFVQQVGFEPPAVVLAVQSDRDILATLRSSRRFCINVLADGDTELLRHFAGKRDEDDPFAELAVARTAGDVPFLLDSLAQLECELVGEAADWTDHTVLCGRVVAGHRASLDDRPTVHVRRNGLSY